MFYYTLKLKRKTSLISLVVFILVFLLSTFTCFPSTFLLTFPELLLYIIIFPFLSALITESDGEFVPWQPLVWGKSVVEIICCCCFYLFSVALWATFSRLKVTDDEVKNSEAFPQLSFLFCFFDLVSRPFLFSDHKISFPFFLSFSKNLRERSGTLRFYFY